MSEYFMNMVFSNATAEEFVTDKQKSIGTYKGYMLIRLQKMFKYTGLPDTIPREILETYLLTNGSCIIAKHDNGNLYAFIGSFGGEPDPYYRPTQYIVANPALKMDKTFSLWDTDGQFTKQVVFMRNDVLWMGLHPLMNRYATLLAENTITMRVADIMLRIVALLTAPDDKTKISAEDYMRKLVKGDLSVVGENRFFEGIKLQSPPSNNGSYLTQFIELQQYYKGSFFNEIGLSASFNMKREAIGESEATLNEDTLTPLIETMLQCRQEDVSRLNEIFGTNVTVEFDSAWAENQEEREYQLDALEKEGEPESSEESLENLDNVDLSLKIFNDYISSLSEEEVNMALEYVSQLINSSDEEEKEDGDNDVGEENKDTDD